MLPDVDPDPSHVGIQKIDRTTVDELSEISSAYDSVQAQLDEADRGLNPLGLAKGVVPFDIDPARVEAGETHFEQIFERTLVAVDNAVEVWDFANQLNRMLLFNQDQVDDLTSNTLERERDFKNRLIETFGRPYEDDVGPGGTYPTDYDGPDLYHYTYVDAPALSGTEFDIDELTGEPDSPAQRGRLRSFDATFNPLPGGVNFATFVGEDQSLDCGSNPLARGCTLGDLPTTQLEIEYQTWELPTLSSFAHIKPPNWTGVRPAAGAVQDALDEIMNAQISQRQALDEYEKLRQRVSGTAGCIQAVFNLRAESLRITNAERQELASLTASVEAMGATAIALRCAMRSSSAPRSRSRPNRSITTLWPRACAPSRSWSPSARARRRRCRTIATRTWPSGCSATTPCRNTVPPSTWRPASPISRPPPTITTPTCSAAARIRAGAS